VVEIDGGQHSQEADAERRAIIRAEGYRVLRFWNNEVLGNAEGCARVLTDALAARSPPSNFG
jgi:very-short-patch-repair endonuclease